MAAPRRSQRALHILLLGALAVSLGSCGSPTDARSRLLRKNGQILFGRWTGTTRQLYTVNADGTNLSAIPAPPIRPSDYAGVWSRDGAWIAMSAATPDDYQVDVIDRHGSNLNTIATGLAFGPAWSPDGSRMAFTQYQVTGTAFGVKIATVISVVSTAGGAITQLTPSGATNYQPTWSPDGRRIAFTNDSSGMGSIGVVDATGANLRLLTHSAYGDVAPAWSPTADEIAFNRQMPSGGYELHVMRGDGTGDRTVADNVSSPYPPYWSPDGTRLAFHTQVSGVTQIAVVNVDGTGYAQLTSLAAGAGLPTWSPDGTRIAFISSGDIFVMNADGTQPTNITQTPDIAENFPDWGALPPS